MTMNEPVSSPIEPLSSAEACRRIVASCDQETTEVGSLVALVEQVPQLRSLILRAANSVNYGLSRRVESLRGALLILGRSRLRDLSQTELNYISRQEKRDVGQQRIDGGHPAQPGPTKVPQSDPHLNRTR